MAIIGVSKPYYGIYNYNEADRTVTYTQGGVMGKATEVNIEIETSEDNNLYGDNAIAETDRQFTGGTLTNSTTDLSQSVSRVILGLVEQVLESIPGVTDVNVRELIYDDRQVTPYLGVGFIIKKKVNGVTSTWRFRTVKRKPSGQTWLCRRWQSRACGSPPTPGRKTTRTSLTPTHPRRNLRRHRPDWRRS